MLKMGKSGFFRYKINNFEILSTQAVKIDLG